MVISHFFSPPIWWMRNISQVKILKLAFFLKVIENYRLLTLICYCKKKSNEKFLLIIVKKQQQHKEIIVDLFPFKCVFSVAFCSLNEQLFSYKKRPSNGSNWLHSTCFIADFNEFCAALFEKRKNAFAESKINTMVGYWWRMKYFINMMWIQTKPH